jgi:hypothetical protein
MGMKIQLAITILTMLIYASFLNAQDTSKYESQTIYMQKLKYVKDGHLYRMGFIGNKLKQEMLISPDALKLFEKYQKKQKWGNAMTLLMVGAGIISFSAERGSTLSNGAFISMGVFALAGITITYGADDYFNKAIWLRNRDVLK